MGEKVSFFGSTFFCCIIFQPFTIDVLAALYMKSICPQFSFFIYFLFFIFAPSAIAEAVGLGAACEYLTKIGMDKIYEHEVSS